MQLMSLTQAFFCWFKKKTKKQKHNPIKQACTIFKFSDHNNNVHLYPVNIIRQLLPPLRKYDALSNESELRWHLFLRRILII